AMCPPPRVGSRRGYRARPCGARTRPPAAAIGAAPRSDPVARAQEVAVEALLRRARLGLPVVAPGRERRHRGEDRLHTAARLEAEARAAVVHEVEFDVAAAPVELEAPLALAVRRRL